MLERWQLEQRQSLPLEAKIARSIARIREWHDHWEGQVYVAFSGGKDSTVLLDLVRGIYPNVPAVFVDTGLEFPEVRDFVKTVEGVTWIKPTMSFREVLRKYGFPVVSKNQAQNIYEYRTTKSEKLRAIRWEGKGPKRVGGISYKWKFLVDAPFPISHKCCFVMKKSPSAKYERKTGRKAYVGTMASDSMQRRLDYLANGCNAYESKRQQSAPLGPWRDSDVWEYIKARGLDYAKVYDYGWDRTGCIFCGFGVHMEPLPNRFQRMAKTHPRLLSYCLDKLKMRQVLDFLGVKYEAPEESNRPEPAGVRRQGRSEERNLNGGQR